MALAGARLQGTVIGVGVSRRTTLNAGGWEALDPNSHGALMLGVNSETAPVVWPPGIGELGAIDGITRKGDGVPCMRPDTCVDCNRLDEVPNATHELRSRRGVTGVDFGLFMVFCAADAREGSMMAMRSSFCTKASFSTSWNFSDNSAFASAKSSNKPQNWAC